MFQPRWPFFNFSLFFFFICDGRLSTHVVGEKVLSWSTSNTWNCKTTEYWGSSTFLQVVPLPKDRGDHSQHWQTTALKLNCPWLHSKGKCMWVCIRENDIRILRVWVCDCILAVNAREITIRIYSCLIEV